MNISVGNLNWTLTEQDLVELFALYGEVTSARIVVDDNNRSRGIGFVDMANDVEGQVAIQPLNGTEIGGRNIVVKESQGGGGGSGGGFRRSR